MTYLGAAPTTTASRKSQVTYRYLMTAGQSVISGSDLNNNTLSCDPLDTEIFMNGLKLDSTDTTITATQVTLAVPAAAGDEIEVVAYRTFESADHYTKSAADARYYTQTDADTRYVNASGDTVTGALTVDTSTTTNLTVDSGNYGGIQFKAAGTDTGYITSYTNGSGAESMYIGGADAVYLHTGTNHGLTNGTTRLGIDGSGRVTKPYQPSFKAHGTVNAYRSTTPVVFDSISQRGGHNVGNHYNTSNGVFTAPVAGRYLFHAHFGIARITSGGGSCYPNLTKNGASIMYTYLNAPSATMYANVHLTQIVDLAVNDTVGVTFNNSNADYYNGHGELAFAGCLLG